MYSPGYLASITINNVTYEDFTSTANWTGTRNVANKTKLGQEFTSNLSLTATSALSVQMHLESTVAAAIEAAFMEKTPITYKFRAGALGTVDFGERTGEAIITEQSYDGEAEGEWNAAMQLIGTGPWAYTAPV